MASSAAATSGRIGAERPAFMSTWTSICSAVASSAAVGAVVHRVIDEQPLGIDAEHLGGEHDRLVHRRFAQVVDVGLDGVEAVARGTVGLVVADVAEQRVAGPADGGEVGRLGHVAVVVDPSSQHAPVVEVERGRHDLAGFPTGRVLQQPALRIGPRDHKLNIHSGFRDPGISDPMPRPRLDRVRRAQIVAAAAAVLSERGYANTRIVDIAKAAGTSPAAVLYWFDGKRGLLAEALAMREEEFHDRYTVRVESAGTASEQLRILIAAMLRHYDWGLWMELCVLALRDPAASAERERMDRRWRAMLRQVIRDGQAGAEFIDGDAEETMFVLAALLDGMAPLLAMKAEGVTLQRVERIWLVEASSQLGPRLTA